MRIRASERATKRTVGTASLCGLLLVASAGVAGSANAATPRNAAPAVADLLTLPQGPPDVVPINDIQVTIAPGKVKTGKDGKKTSSITFTVKSVKPQDGTWQYYPGAAVDSVGFQAASKGDGVVFNKVSAKGKSCSVVGDHAGIVCDLGKMDIRDSITVTADVELKGTTHSVGASAKSKSGKPMDPRGENNNLDKTWTSKAASSPKPSTKPEPKPSSKDPKPPKPPEQSSTKPSTKPSPKTPKTCPRAVIEYSKDNGKTWSRSGLLQGFPGKLKVRTAGKIEKDCKYDVSLASYSAQGPTWKTSGTQAFLGKDTVTLTAKKPTGELNISKKLPKCFGQVDLYGNKNQYDGKKHGGKVYDLPKFPDQKNPKNLIAGWNGGKACAPKPPTTTPKPSTSPSKSPSKSPSASPSASESASESPSPSTTPSETPTSTPTETPTQTPTETPTETPTTTPSASPTSSFPAPPPSPPAPDQEVAQPPVAQDDQQPTEDTSAPGTLAKTGADSRLPYLAAMAVFTILLGMLAVWWTQGRRDESPAAARNEK